MTWEDQISNLSTQEVIMKALIARDYDDFFKAEENRLKFLKMQKEYLVDLARRRRGYQRQKRQDQIVSDLQPTKAGPERLAQEPGLRGPHRGFFIFNPERLKVWLNS